MEMIGSRVEVALRRGRLIRAKRCEVCSAEGAPTRRGNPIEGHHDDYNRPLAVRWLCKSCHKKWHVANTPVSPDLVAYALIKQSLA